MTAYYNENDAHAAQWLRNLIDAGHIAPGVVDERDVRDVKPDDIKRFTQCHFFAGVGVWSYALRRAGWPDDRRVWTGSCPCQPFSAAGKNRKFDDERHLWPYWHWLIERCRPTDIFGEQVASKDGLGWLDLVQADLEGTGYASRAFDLCAAGFGAPHIRQRIYFDAERMGDAIDTRFQGHAWYGDSASGRAITARPIAEAGSFDQLAVTPNIGCDIRSGLQNKGPGRWRNVSADNNGGGRDQERRDRPEARDDGVVGDGALIGVGNAADEPRERFAGSISGAQAQEHEEGQRFDGRQFDRPQHASKSVDPGYPRPTNGFGRDADWLFCRDGKWRPVEPGTFPLAHGATGRVGRLRAYGNAINAAQAQSFVEAAIEFRELRHTASALVDFL